MKKQIAMNVFYTLGIIVSVLGIKWGFENNQQVAGGFFIVTTIFFLYLKIKLTRDFRKALRDRANQS